MIKLKVIKACHGDAFILQVSNSQHHFNMVIDGGPRASYTTFKDEMDSLDQIDLIVLTHFHDDHIYGIGEYLQNNKDKAKKVAKYWVNMPELVKLDSDEEEVSYAQAKSLKDLLEELSADSDLDWKDNVIQDKEFSDKNNLIKITVISPCENDKKKNEEAYRAEIENSNNKDEEVASPKESIKDIPLEDLVDKKFYDRSILNKSSIALLIEASDGDQTKKFLMAGDASHKVITDYLKKNGYSEDRPLVVDVFKLPHHGSKHNSSNKLFSLVRSDIYLISTNGGINNEYHPNRETLAKLILNEHRDKNKKMTICLNYDLETIRDQNPGFLSDEEINRKDYNIEIIPDTEVL